MVNDINTILNGHGMVPCPLNPVYLEGGIKMATRKGRRAALKAWTTRRENERKRKASETARKAWVTRKLNEAARSR